MTARSHLQGVALKLAAGQSLDAQGGLASLEGGCAVDGEGHGQDDHQASSGQATRALRHTLAHIPEGP